MRQHLNDVNGLNAAIGSFEIFHNPMSALANIGSFCSSGLVPRAELQRRVYAGNSVNCLDDRIH